MIALVALVLVVLVLVAVSVFAWLVVVPFGRALPASVEDLRARLDAVRATDELRDLVTGLRGDVDEIRDEVAELDAARLQDREAQSNVEEWGLQQVYEAQESFRVGEARLDRALSKLAGTGLVGDLREDR